jgi:hypothetical protein
LVGGLVQWWRRRIRRQPSGAFAPALQEVLAKLLELGVQRLDLLDLLDLNIDAIP